MVLVASIETEENKEEAIMDSNNNTHNDFNQQSNSGLLRFRSAPSSLFVNFTENGNFGVNKTIPFEGSESEKLFSRFGFSGNIDSDSSSQNFRDFDDKSMVTALNTQQRCSGLPPHYPRHSLSSSGFGLDNSSFGLMGSVGLDHNTHSKTANLNLVRQSSSPAGLFSHLSVQNGYATSKGAGNYNGLNGIDKQVSTKRLKGTPQIGFSSGLLPSFEILSQIPEINNEGLDDEKLESGLSYGSCPWRHSSNSIENYSDRKLSSNIQNEEFGNGVRMLSHHLSFPKASSDEQTREKFLYFQDSVPCKIRAKRGCATHPRSIAERVRRTRISDRMRKLQEIVPNMDKQTNTADMLDLAVEYIKGLQEQFKTLNDSRAKCKCLSMQKPFQNQVV